MKNIQKILWLGLLVSAVGCNSGVFIDDYLPEVPVVQLSETDSVARINFKSDNWDILNIYGASENVWGVVCDLEGKPDGRNLPLENGANAVIKMAKINSSHIAIPTILKVEDGALSKIGPYLQESNLQKVVIYFGNGLIDMFGQKVLSSLHNAGIEVLEYCELDTVDIDDIIRIAFALPNSTQAVIGLGGGKVIDAAKYMGFLRKLPFISVPTSASSDGFSSASASLLINKRRSSVPARMAYGIIVDTDVIKSAPEKFLYSGIGDMVSKITSLYDWQFEAEHGAAQVNDFAMMIAKKAVNSFVRTPFETIHDRLFLKELLDSLAMSGIANEIAGSSAPTSGSEYP